MSYVVLARKWRPQRFEDLVGQEHVARTLSNAIRAGRVAHAFLFTGVRGVGKTTSARILAKALNCMGDPDGEPATGPTPTPCLKCAACREITAGTDMDVREIDGASYNGVDEVRRLQDTLPYRPTRDRFKIFVVDEVQMLSQSAWNAFLKTLEEPPPHVKFIFATTEVHKVPVTILSRVQRFDFKLISARSIADRLREVLEREKIQSDESALTIIAREAAGSMRDAMSLLDQVIAWNSEALAGEDVASVLGVASRQAMHDLGAALVGGNAAGCLALIGALAEQGRDIGHIARQLLELLRDLVVCKICDKPGSLIDLPDDEREKLEKLAKERDTNDVVRLYHGFSQSFDDVVRSGQPRAALEMLLVRLAQRPALVPLDDLVVRLSALERRLAGGAGSGGARDPGGGGAGRQPREARGRSRESRPSPAGRAGEEPSGDEPPGAPPEPAPRTTAPLAAVPAPESREAAVVEAPAVTETPGAEYHERLETLASVLENLRATRPELAAFLEHAVPLSVTGDALVLGFSPGFDFARQLCERASLEALERAGRERFGRVVKITLRFDCKDCTGFPTLSSLNNQERQKRKREATLVARGHPRIAEAEEILGARLKELRLEQD
jgi:DNA polymerase-3 subunit gamma/tau